MITAPRDQHLFNHKNCELLVIDWTAEFKEKYGTDYTQIVKYWQDKMVDYKSKYNIHKMINFSNLYNHGFDSSYENVNFIDTLASHYRM